MKHTSLKISLGVIALIFSASIGAQDIIVTNDAKKIEAKILEVSKNEIKYKEFNYQDGPTFTLGFEDINSIIYANGKVALYNQDKAKDEHPKSAQKNEEDEELKVWIEESDKQSEAKHKSAQDQMDRLQQQAAESGEKLGQAIGDLIQSENSYALDVQNTTKDPYRIKLDGHILGVVNPYKTERFIVSVEIYGKMQAVQTSGTLFLPSMKEYKIPRQQKKTVCTVIIRELYRS